MESLDPLMMMFPDMSPYGLASEGGPGDGVRPPAQKTDEKGNKVDWEYGDEYYDWNGEGNLDRYKLGKKSDGSLYWVKTENYYEVGGDEGATITAERPKSNINYLPPINIDFSDNLSKENYKVPELDNYQPTILTNDTKED